MSTVLINTSILEKIILGRYFSLGAHQMLVKNIEEFLEATPPVIHESALLNTLLSYLGGEKMLEHCDKEQAIYSSIPVIFDHLAQRKTALVSGLCDFMEKATVQLASYGHSHHIFSGIPQFAQQALHKMYKSILVHKSMLPAQRLYILGLLCKSLFKDGCEMRWNLHKFIADQYLLITEDILKPSEEQRTRLKNKIYLWMWNEIN